MLTDQQLEAMIERIPAIMAQQRRTRPSRDFMVYQAVLNAVAKLWPDEAVNDRWVRHRLNYETMRGDILRPDDELAICIVFEFRKLMEAYP